MRKTLPAFVTVIAILHFVFGSIGVLQNICAGAMLASGINQMLLSGGSGPQGTRQHELLRDMQKAMESMPAYHLVQYTSLGGDLLISIMMIMSGMGLLRMRPWGRYLSILYAILSILIKIFGVVYALFFTLPTVYEFMNTHQQSAPEVQMTFSIMRMTTVISPVMLVLFMIYPIVVLIIMLLPSNAAAFRGEEMKRHFPDYDDPDEPVDVERADGW